MLSIRLQRIGRKHQPSYRLVVAERRSKLGGEPVEDLGSYNPFSKAANFHKERVLYWMKAGAQPTVTAHNLLVKEGVLQGSKINLKFKVPEKPAEPEVVAQPDAPAAVEAEAVVAEAPVEEVKAEAQE